LYVRKRFSIVFLSRSSKNGLEMAFQAEEDFAQSAVTLSFLACLKQTAALFEGLDVLDVLRVFIGWY